MSSKLTTRAQMREIQGQSLDPGVSPSDHGPKPERIDKTMIAANERNGVSFDEPRGEPLCSLSGEGQIDTAHILSHSYWSSPRLHEWMFYAGVIPLTGSTYKAVQKMKLTERNILWLRPEWARLMEPTRGGLIVVPEVSKLIEQAKAILNNIPPHPLNVWRDFSAPLLLKDWTESVQVTAVDFSNVYPYSIWFTNRISSGEFPQALERLVFFRGHRSVHTVNQDTDTFLPLAYEPPLPTGWEWCLCPIIASLVAWKTLTEAPAHLTLTAEALNKSNELDEYLRLCESETPSSWTITEHQTPSLEASPNSNPDLRRREFQWELRRLPCSGKIIPSNFQPPDLNPPSTSSDHKRKRSQKAEQVNARTRRRLQNDRRRRQRDDAREADQHPENAGQGGQTDDTGDEDVADASAATKHTGDDVSEDETDTSLKTDSSSFDSDVEMTIQERYDALQMRIRDNDVAEDLAKSLGGEEDIMVQKASCLIQETFQKMAGEIGFSQAMRWLRSSKRDDVDKEVEELKEQWMKSALELEEEYLRESEEQSEADSSVSGCQ